MLPCSIYIFGRIAHGFGYGTDQTYPEGHYLKVCVKVSISISFPKSFRDDSAVRLMQINTIKSIPRSS